MCVIALVKPSESLDIGDFNLMWNTNPHGGGIMFAHEGEIKIGKTLDKEEMWEMYNEAKALTNNPIGVHFRISTSGKIDLPNCHPFYVNPNVGLMHNGMLPVTVPKKSPINDTQIFINEYLGDIDLKLSNNPLLTYLGRSIGRGNKFLLMDNEGNYELINPSEWVEDKGLFLSNIDYKFIKLKKYESYYY